MAVTRRQRERLREPMQDIEIAMFTTIGQRGFPVSRPRSTRRSEFDGEALRFFARGPRAQSHEGPRTVAPRAESLVPPGPRRSRSRAHPRAREHLPVPGRAVGRRRQARRHGDRRGARSRHGARREPHGARAQGAREARPAPVRKPAAKRARAGSRSAARRSPDAPATVAETRLEPRRDRPDIPPCGRRRSTWQRVGPATARYRTRSTRP